MKTIGIIGTGIMGSGMAVNFLKKGYMVVVWNRTPEKLVPLLALGAKPAITPREAAAQADMVFEVTADDDSSREVWLGDDGILAGSTPDKILVASGTFSVKWVDELAGLSAKKSLLFFDIPLTGGRSGAETGQLIMLAGGDPAKLNHLKPDLAAIAKKVMYFGPVGSGARFKLILNMLQAIHVTAFGGAMRLAKKFDLNLNAVGEVLAERPGGEVTNTAWLAYQSSKPETTFSAHWMYKDLQYAHELLEGMDVAFLNDALAAYKKIVDDGKGNEDWTIVSR